MSRTCEFKLTFDDADELVIEACARASGQTFDQFVATWTQEWFKSAMEQAVKQVPEIAVLKRLLRRQK